MRDIGKFYIIVTDNKFWPAILVYKGPETETFYDEHGIERTFYIKTSKHQVRDASECESWADAIIRAKIMELYYVASKTKLEMSKLGRNLSSSFLLRIAEDIAPV